MSAPQAKPAEEMVTIPETFYARLTDDSRKLSALEAAGVDNWDGYEHAMRMRREMEKE